MWHTPTYPSSGTSSDLGFHDNLAAKSAKASDLTFIQNVKVAGWF